MQEGGSLCTPKSSAKSEQIAPLLVPMKLCYTQSNNQDAVSYVPHTKGCSETRRQGNFSSSEDQQQLMAEGGGCKGRYAVRSSWTSGRMELAHSLRPSFFSYWGHSTSEGISEPPLQVLCNESVCGRDKKKQLKPTDVYALKL